MGIFAQVGVMAEQMLRSALLMAVVEKILQDSLQETGRRFRAEHKIGGWLLGCLNNAITQHYNISSSSLPSATIPLVEYVQKVDQLLSNHSVGGLEI